MIVPKTCSIILGLGVDKPVVCDRDPYWWIITRNGTSLECECDRHKYFHRTKGITYEDALAYAAMESL